MNLTNQECIQQEEECVAHNYTPLPICLERGEGVYVWDVEGKRYIDCVGGVSTASFGHCHPKLVKILAKQASTLGICSRTVHSYELAEWGAFVTKLFGYDRALPSTGGVEAVETAIKVARSWGYQHKGIEDEKAIIICCQRNFHGRSMLAASLSDEPSARQGFGPYLPGIRQIPFASASALRAVLEEEGDNVCGFLVEPIQGEGGINIPPPGYLSECAVLCKKYNVLLIADEVQTGIGRTGKLLACGWEKVRPDLLCLGKALGGGVFPMSAVLGDAELMDCIKRDTHGSTWGGNPMACAVSVATLKLLQEEEIMKDVNQTGSLLLTNLQQIAHSHSSSVATVRGRGLFCCVELNPTAGFGARDLAECCLRYGVLAKPSHNVILRFHPPLVITTDEVKKVTDALDRALSELEGEKGKGKGKEEEVLESTKEQIRPELPFDEKTKEKSRGNEKLDEPAGGVGGLESL